MQLQARRHHHFYLTWGLARFFSLLAVPRVIPSVLLEGSEDIPMLCDVTWTIKTSNLAPEFITWTSKNKIYAFNFSTPLCKKKATISCIRIRTNYWMLKLEALFINLISSIKCSVHFFSSSFFIIFLLSISFSRQLTSYQSFGTRETFVHMSWISSYSCY